MHTNLHVFQGNFPALLHDFTPELQLWALPISTLAHAALLSRCVVLKFTPFLLGLAVAATSDALQHLQTGQVLPAAHLLQLSSP